MRKISKAVFYLENSESVFGYVNGNTEFVDVLSELAFNPRFVTCNVITEFYFINGGDNLVITPIGSDPERLINVLNPAGFQCGDITQSNLNGMFQVAMEKAKGDTISLLISDAIYDIGNKQNPLNELQVWGRITRTRFLERLQVGNMQTIIIKLISDFNGRYFFASKHGLVQLNQKRPYYIWIFGDSELLNENFPDSYLENNLNGFDNLVRLLSLDDDIIPYQIVYENVIGSFRFSKRNPNIITKARHCKYGEGFQFSIAVDFSTLPFSEDYVTDTANYFNDKYKIVGIKAVLKTIHGLNFKPTHLITLHSANVEYGNIEIRLKNKLPGWISQSNANDESDIVGDSIKTFGFGTLTNGIIEAYNYQNREKMLATFSVEIQN